MTDTKRVSRATKTRPARGKMTERDKAEWLQVYVDAQFNYAEACRRTGWHRNTIYGNLKRDEQFRRAKEELEGVMSEEAYSEALRRAVYGYDEPVWHQGEQVGTVRKYSDVLLRDILRAFDPRFRYQHARVEVTGADGGPVEVSETQAAVRLAAILAAAQRRKEMGIDEAVDAEFEEADSPEDDELEFDPEDLV